MSVHANCTHENSKSARARCRRVHTAQIVVTPAEKRAEIFASVLRQKGWKVKISIDDHVQEPGLAPRRYVSLYAYSPSLFAMASISGMWVSILPNEKGRRTTTKWVAGDMYRSYATGKKRRKLNQKDFARWVNILA